MNNMRKFLKMHTIIPNEFIDDFLSMNPSHPSLQTDFIIDLDIVAKWLEVRKDNLLQTLKYSYKKDIDYIVKKTLRPNKTKYGGNNYKKIMLTPDCFKRLCMLSRSKKAEDVRTYYIEIEALMFKHYQQTLDGMQMEIKQLENALKPKHNSKERAGYIYVLKASHKKDSIYKIGRTKNLRYRLDTYQTGKYEDIDVVYKYRTDNLKPIEDCLKLALKDMRPRKYKEIYKVDIDIIKQVISKCQQIENIKRIIVSRKESPLTGGYYIGIFNE